MAGNNLGQPAYPSPASQQMSTGQLRNLFLSSAMLKCQRLTSQTAAANTTYNSQVVGTGIAAFIRLCFDLTLTGATATLTPGPKAPYNIPSNGFIQFVDPSGNQRVNTPGFELYLLSLVKKQWDYDPSSGNAGSWVTQLTTTAPYLNPTLAVGANAVRFWIDVPFMLSPADTRGGILLESATSQSFLSYGIPALASLWGTAAGADTPYSSLTGTITGIAGTIVPYYYYYAPTYVATQGGNILPIPYDDLSVIHELFTNRASGAISQANEQRYTLQTGRSYQRIIGSYVNNGALSDAITDVKFAYDGSTYTLNESRNAYYARVRDAQSRDLPQGCFWWDFTRRPWDSNHYGELDVILATDSTTTLTNPYMQFLRESIYVAPQA